MPFSHVNDLDMYYELHGTGPLIVFISGFATHHLFWESYIEPLSKKFTLLLLDNRGSGQTESSEPPYSIKMMADDIAALLEHLQLPTAHIVGHSMGGMIALQIALDHPDKVKRLVLCATGAALPATTKLQLRTSYDFIQANIERSLIIQSVLPWLFSDQFLNNSSIEAILHSFLHDPYPQDMNGYLGQMDALLSANLKDQLHLIPHKSLIVTGQLDFFTPPHCAQELGSGLTDAHVTILPHQAHQFPSESTEPLVELIKKFCH